MKGNNWTQRVSGRNTPSELQQIGAAVRNLAQEAGHTKGRTGVVFQRVAQVTIVATALATGALAFYQLWKELSRPHREPQHGRTPDTAGAGRSPPRNRGRHTATSAADEPDRHHGRG